MRKELVDIKKNQLKILQMKYSHSSLQIKNYNGSEAIVPLPWSHRALSS